eukprot:Selendium_serpulae@DN5143_c0_g1_i2.p1
MNLKGKKVADSSYVSSLASISPTTTIKIDTRPSFYKIYDNDMYEDDEDEKLMKEGGKIPQQLYIFQWSDWLGVNTQLAAFSWALMFLAHHLFWFILVCICKDSDFFSGPKFTIAPLLIIASLVGMAAGATGIAAVQLKHGIMLYTTAGLFAATGIMAIFAWGGYLGFHLANYDQAFFATIWDATEYFDYINAIIARIFWLAIGTPLMLLTVFVVLAIGPAYLSLGLK